MSCKEAIIKIVIYLVEIDLHKTKWNVCEMKFFSTSNVQMAFVFKLKFFIRRLKNVCFACIKSIDLFLKLLAKKPFSVMSSCTITFFCFGVGIQTEPLISEMVPLECQNCLIAIISKDDCVCRWDRHLVSL